MTGQKQLGTDDVGQSKLPRQLIKPSLAWLTVFLPALCYYMSTRLVAVGLFRSSSIGQLIQDRLDIQIDSNDAATGNTNAIHAKCKALESIFYISCPHRDAPASSKDSSTRQGQASSDIKTDDDDRIALKRPVYMVQDGTLGGLVATAWRHDSELGRGYVLVSISEGSGRIWRWETGGGPIAIGRSLSVDQSGCRSSQYRQCGAGSKLSGVVGDAGQIDRYGSGGIAIDSSHSEEHFAEGNLIVAEWGEGRIVRMEENGARTPLVIQVPSLRCTRDPPDNEHGAASLRRVNQPSALLFTPFGDLLFVDSNSTPAEQCNGGQQHGIYRLKQISNIEGLPSLPASRKAHAWTDVMHNKELPDIIYQTTSIGGMALAKSWADILVTAETANADGSKSIVVGSLSIQDDEDDDDDDAIDGNGHDGGATAKGIGGTLKVLLDFSSHAAKPGAVAIDSNSNIFLAVDQGVLIANANNQVIGMLALPIIPASLTVGEDNFLYIGTSDSLLRIKIRQGPLVTPTNLIVKR